MGEAERSYRDLEEIFRAGLRRADPLELLGSLVRLEENTLLIGPPGTSGSPAHREPLAFDLLSYERIVVLGAGKASARMALGLERLLGDRISGGVVAVKRGHGEPLQRIRIIEGGHPVPDPSSVAAAQALLQEAEAAGERDLVLLVVSGGGSAILCLPLEDEAAGGPQERGAPRLSLSLADKQQVTRALLGCGATIHEMNCVRKHLSGIKGGRLAQRLYPATSVTLLLSDVVGDEPGVIASGPTVPDESTYADALEVIARWALESSVPEKALRLLRRGAQGRIPETPKPGDPVFERAHTVLAGSNLQSILASARRAAELGYHPLVLTSRLQGQAREVARLFVALGRDCALSGIPLEPPACILAGGETTVTVTGGGKGGRNQELALAYLAELDGRECDGRTFLLSASSDGSDGPTDSAGAFASRELALEARKRGLEPRRYLADNDSYAFFSLLGGHLKTGPTNTNVCDLQILIVR